MRRFSWILAGFALGAGLAAQAADEPAKPPQCLWPPMIRQTTIVDDNTILFQMTDGKVWKNTLRDRCFGLKLEGGFSYEVRGNEICANMQTIRVLRQGSFCELGEFSFPDSVKTEKNKSGNNS